MKTFVFLFPIVLFMLQGCASMPKEADLKESLRSSAEEYWKLRMEDKYEATYAMEYSSGLPPFLNYRDNAMRIKKFQVRSVSIGEIKIEGAKGMVDVKFSVIMPPVPKPFDQTLQEEWIFDNKWWHIFR